MFHPVKAVLVAVVSCYVFSWFQASYQSGVLPHMRQDAFGVSKLVHMPNLPPNRYDEIIIFVLNCRLQEVVVGHYITLIIPPITLCDM